MVDAEDYYACEVDTKEDGLDTDLERGRTGDYLDTVNSLLLLPSKLLCCLSVAHLF